MRNNFKRVIAVVLCAVMLASTVIAVSADSKSYTDVKTSDWYYDFVKYMSDKNIINGYTDNTFRANTVVKRAEFIKMLDETFGLKKTTGISYIDVKSGDWYYEYYQKAAAQGYITEVYPNTYKMNPTDNLTREEAVSLLMAYLDLPTGEVASSSMFTDYSKINSSYRTYVLQAIKASIIDGFKEDNGTYTFRPQNTLTRAQAAKILNVAAGTIADDDLNTLEADKNLVITDNVTLYNLKIKGNVYVSEGITSGTVTLMGCSVDGRIFNRSSANLVLSGCSVDEINTNVASAKISLKQTSSIDTFNVNKTATIDFYNSSYVSDMVINAAAANTKINDNNSNGRIYNLTDSAARLTSAVVPTNTVINGNVTATIGSETYAAGFKGDVRTVWSVNDEYLAFTTYRSGYVRYYYTSVNATPTTSTFTTNYINAAYKGNFSVVNGSAYNEKIFGTSVSTTTYPYVVAAFVDGTNVNQPVIINRLASKTGFTVNPEATTYGAYDAVKLTAKYQGTLYCYYTNDATVPTSYTYAEAIYGATATEFKKLLAVSGGYSETKSTVLTSVAESFKYCVVFFCDKYGTKYDPMLLERPSATDGFKVAPEVVISDKVDGKDTLTFTPSSSGYLKYVYTNSNAEFTISYFNAEYNASPSTVKGQFYASAATKVTHSLLTSATCTYNYVVVMMTDSTGTSHTPIKLARKSSSTGFKTAPVVYSTNTKGLVSFETSETGTVKFVYITSNTAYTIEQFNKAYAAADTKLRFEVSANGVYSGTTGEKLAGNYVVFMFIDSKGNSYNPVTVAVKAGGNGFAATPSVFTYVSDGQTKLTEKTIVPATIHYFGTDSNSNIACDQFMDLGKTKSMTSITTTGAEETVVLTITGEPKYIAMMVAKDGEYFTPVIIERSVIDYGAVITDVYFKTEGEFRDSIKGTTSANGELKYYYTNTVPKTAAEFNAAYAKAAIRSYVTVTNKEFDFESCLTSVVADYQYIAYMLTDDKNIVYTPNVYTVPDAHTMLFTANVDAGGQLSISSPIQEYSVYWFYSSTKLTTLTSQSFLSSYNSANISGKGNKSETDYNDNNVTNVLKKTETCKYLYIAVSKNSTFYAPGVIELK